MRSWLRSGIEKSYERYNHASLQTILSLVFTCVSVVVIVVISLNYSRQFSHSTEKLMASNSMTVLDQVNLNLESYLHSMMGISNAAYYNIIKDADMEKDDQAFQEKLAFLYKSHGSSVRNISVFRANGRLIGSYPMNQMKPDTDVTKEEWFIKATSKIENVHFSKPYVENSFYSENNPYHWVVSLSRSVELTENGVIFPGVLVINMDVTEIENISKSVSLGESGYVYIIDSDGEFIYHPRQQLILSELWHENNQAALTYPEGTQMETFEGQKRQITIKNMGYSGWKIVAVSPVSDYLGVYQTNRNYLFLSVLVASIALFLVIRLVSSRVTTPIKKLEQAVLRIEQDIDNCHIPQEGTTEVRQLARTLTSMTDTLRRLMKDVVKQERSKRKTEMIALQSQINPHFLYNTLDSTVWMIESEQYDGAITMITSLAHFFRISLSKGNHVITLQDEFAHVESYLTIQKIRYKNKFEYELELSDDVKEAETVKLIVQPIVENAIYHGMDHLFEDGFIRVSGRLEQGLVHIVVSDNGPGMTPSQLKALHEGHSMSKKKARGSGIGLTNVDERVKLFYGESYGVSIESEPDEGTKAHINYPFTSLTQKKEDKHG